MTYDVPVKLFAFHLIVLSLLLLAPQIPQLFRVLVLSGFGTPSTDSEVVPSLRPGRRLVAAQILFGIYIVAINLYGARQAWWQYGGGAPKSPLYGIWNVDQMSIDGQIRSPLLTDYDRWRRVIFDRPGSMALQRMNDTVVFYVVTIDAAGRTITPTQPANAWTTPLRFQRSAPDRLSLDGDMNHHRVHMELRLFDRNGFLLVTRGFHWVQEYPFNR